MFSPDSYTIAANWFPRFLGFIYFFAFGAFFFQVKGLLGSQGILPVASYLKLVRQHYPRNYFHLLPSLFWLCSTDFMLMSVVIGGTAIAGLLMLGVYPSLLLLLLYILYLSIVSAGQDFLSFGWEGFLLEITMNAFFMSLTSPPNLMVWVSINLLLFRFHLQAGAVKLQSQDKNWRNLTAIAFHYQSQPLPNLVAWYVYKLPMWFHKISTFMMFLVEIPIAFGVFGHEPIRLMVFFCFFGLQLMIWATGNFSYLNHLTAAFSTLLVSNAFLLSWINIPLPQQAGSPWLDSLCTAAGTALTILQAIRLWQHFIPNPLFGSWLRMLSPYHIANQYGIFAIMTTTRNEVIFEGSNDGKSWKEYNFFYKPSEVNRRPRRISPYQPRVDWQAWFLPLGHYRFDSWYENFIYHLLKGSPAVASLLRTNPFPNTPPLYVRTSLYEYEFSSMKEKKEFGWWWRRKRIGIFTPPVRLKDTDAEWEEEKDIFE